MKRLIKGFIKLYPAFQ